MKKIFSLKFKLIVYTLFFTVISVFSVGYVTNKHLAEHFSSDAKGKFREAFLDVATRLKNTEKDILESVRLISQNEEIIASMNLIENYEDIDNYDSIIFDEEKKRIVDNLLVEGKYSLSDHISIYDSNHRLVAFVYHTKDKHLGAFISYKDAKPVYNSKIIDDDSYTQNTLQEDLAHIDSCSSNDIQSGSVLYAKHNNIFVLKAKQSILRKIAGGKTEIIGYIETSKHFSKKGLNEIIPSNMHIDYEFYDKKITHNIPLLFSNYSLVDLPLYTAEDIFFTKVEIPFVIGSLIFKITTDKHGLEEAMLKNRQSFMTILIFIILITFAISLLVLNKMISVPVEKLLKGIEIISGGNYQNRIDINSNDELGLISSQFNNMANEIAEREMQLDALAHYDALTKIPNRVMFLKRLNSSIKRAKRLNTKLAVFFLDLDDFKNINDTLGHHMGDKLLIEVAKNLSKVMRENDIISRIGGDEFNIMIEDLDSLTHIHNIANKFIQQMKIPINIDDNQINITGSIGISIYPNDGEDSTTLLKNADLAMYKAKDNGRNRYSFFSKELEVSLQNRIRMLRELKYAVKKDELQLFYQPKFSLKDGTIYAAEALIRWENKELGFVTPDKFIPLAEESGEIVKIGAWVIEQACKDFASFQNLGLSIKQVSVNVSNTQFAHDDVVKVLRDNIKSSGISAEALEVEITESYMQEDSDKALQILHDIRALGVDLAMDDFGTGYSSMSYLKRLPINRLKIDRSFISDIPHDSDDVEITKIIVSLAKIMGLNVTAEGIETLDQMHFLQELGVDEGQGYICAKPLPFEQFVELLKNKRNCIN